MDGIMESVSNGHEEAGQTLEGHILHGVPVVSSFAVDDRLQRGVFGYMGQVHPLRDDLPDVLSPFLPALLIVVSGGEPVQGGFAFCLGILSPLAKHHGINSLHHKTRAQQVEPCIAQQH